MRLQVINNRSIKSNGAIIHTILTLRALDSSTTYNKRVGKVKGAVELLAGGAAAAVAELQVGAGCALFRNDGIAGCDCLVCKYFADDSVVNIAQNVGRVVAETHVATPGNRYRPAPEVCTAPCEKDVGIC